MGNLLSLTRLRSLKPDVSHALINTMRVPELASPPGAIVAIGVVGAVMSQETKPVSAARTVLADQLPGADRQHQDLVLFQTGVAVSAIVPLGAGTLDVMHVAELLLPG